MKDINSKLALDIKPSKGNPRNSEGSFIRMDDGTILFAYSRYSGDDWHDHQPSDIALIRSTDEGESWSEPEIIVSAQDVGATNVMSVSAIRQNDGKIGFYFLAKLFDNPETCDGLHSIIVRALTSDGVNFHAERTGFSAPKGYYIFNNDRLVRLSDGRLAYPAGCVDGRKSSSTVFISDDDGASFTIHEKTLHMSAELRSERGFEEPGLIEHKDGSIRFWMRTDMGYQYECYSYDNLKTFTNPVPSEFTSPRSPMEIERAADGTLYTVYNPIPAYNGRYMPRATNGGRNPLIIRKSIDDGKTWGECFVIEADPERGFCYPAMFFTKDNSLLLSYCRGGEDDGFCLTRLGIRKISLEEIDA